MYRRGLRRSRNYTTSLAIGIRTLRSKEMRPHSTGWETFIISALVLHSIIGRAPIGMRRPRNRATRERGLRLLCSILTAAAARKIAKRPRGSLTEAAEKGDPRGLHNAAIMHLER